MSDLVLAIPSKGRLEEQTREVFAHSGLPIARPGGARSYLGHLEGLKGVTVRFLPAGDIARELIRGTVDAGVTGIDLIYEASETGPDAVVFACALGFGEADVVIAVPDAWIDVVDMADLADVASDFRQRHGRWLRVATKYVNLTRQLFSKAGISGYRIVESVGATEAAPASGAADLIVDITSTGSTLSANGLRVLKDGVILHSEATLIVSRQMDQAPGRRMVLRELLRRIGADIGRDEDEPSTQPVAPNRA